MASYQEQIAQLRQQRAAAEYAQQLENLKTDYAESVQLRDEAARRGDAEGFHYWDSQAETLENDWRRYFAPTPQMPQVDPRLAAYHQRKKTFLDRHGTAAAAAMDEAHRYATRPRTGSANPAHTGMGLQPGTPQYFRAMDDLLEMYAPAFGLKYDPKEDAVHPNEAARISGVRPAEYNNGVKLMYQLGKNSAAENAANWGRKAD